MYVFMFIFNTFSVSPSVEVGASITGILEFGQAKYFRLKIKAAGMTLKVGKNA